jgi:hypothetical protein
MMIRQPAIRCKREETVVKGLLRGACFDSFIHSDDYANLEVPRSGSQLGDLGTFDGNAAFPQLGEHLFCWFMIPERGSRTDIEPGRIPRKPSFAESDKRGTAARSIPDEIKGFGKAGSFIVVNGRSLGDRYTDASDSGAFHGNHVFCGNIQIPVIAVM